MTAEAEDAPSADVAGERSVLDLDDVDADAWLDVTPGSQEDDAEPTSQRERLLRMARRADVVELHLANLTALREAMGGQARMLVRFELPVADGVTYLSRTHPAVEGLAAYVMDAALDPLLDGRARRCGAIRTAAVTTRTTLLLLRLRHHVVTVRSAGESQLLAEECIVAGFRGAPDSAFWLSEMEAETLLAAEPSGNILPQQATNFVRQVVDGIGNIRTHIDQIAVERAQELLEAHRRVRIASRQSGLRYEVRPQLPVDVLGIYVLLPAVELTGHSALQAVTAFCSRSCAQAFKLLP